MLRYRHSKAQEAITTEKKRKTFTSYEVKKRHKDKTYKQISVAFRYDSDADILQAFSDAKANGTPPAELIRQLIRNK